MKINNDKVDALALRIEKYQKSYYTGEAEISDEEFDLLWEELKYLSPNHHLLKKVGNDSVDGFPKLEHIIPMGSQDKAQNPEEFITWAEKSKIKSFVVQLKLDGASLELQYNKGVLTNAVTRGDGITGDNITANVLRMTGSIKNITKDFTGGIRGEVIMLRAIWEEHYKDKANCRNAANGIMRRKDGSGCENLCIICYDAAFTGNDSYFNNEIEKINWLKKQGFNVSDTKEFDDTNKIIAYREEIAEKRKNIPYDIDGLVVKDFLTDMTDLRRAKPEFQIAFKFEPEAAYSVLKEIEWSETGATYTPIGIINPVRLAGTTVQRANLNNPGMIRSMGLKIGSMVKVVKRGDIIPKIESLAPKEIHDAGETKNHLDIIFPEICSTCGTKLIDMDTRLYCPNPNCDKKLLHRLEKWVSVLDIRELGDKLLRQLFDTKKVRAISDLYSLKENDLSILERMGDLSASKVINHINTKRSISLAAFVAGFDLDGVGELVMEKVINSGFTTLEKLFNAGKDELNAIHGIGEITADTIYQGLLECRKDMEKVLSFSIISIQDAPDPDAIPLKGISFCFTGELKTMKRNLAEEKVKKLGGSVRSAVVKDLSYLVTNDPASGSGKAKKALDLGIKIIDEDTFLTLINNKINKEALSNSHKISSTQKELF